jgi:hypothetical protein
MMRKMRKSRCPKETTLSFEKVKEKKAIFIIWVSKKDHSFLKTGILLQIQNQDLKIKIHDCSSSNSFIEEESIGFGDTIYFRSSFLGLTFKSPFISNADENCFWVQAPTLILLNEKRNYPRKSLNPFNWKKSIFKFEDEKGPSSIFSSQLADDPLIEEFYEDGQPSTEIDHYGEPQIPLVEKSIPNLLVNIFFQGVIIEISKKGATLLISLPSETEFKTQKVLHFDSIEGLSIPSDLKGTIRSIREGKVLYRENSLETFFQLGLEFNHFIKI